jgi:four helix bundle protein
MQRAAVSIPSNIAEGFVRGHTAEYRQYLVPKSNRFAIL